MTITRRQLLSRGAAAGAAFAFARRAFPFAQSPANIRKFVVTLPGLGPAGANNIGNYIPLATKTTGKFAGLSTDMYSVAVGKFAQRIHRDLPAKTHFWGYSDVATGDQKYLAGVIVATRGTPILLSVTNQLPNNPLVPVDPTLMASATQSVGDLPMNRIATHLHGGLTPWFSDGTPFQWFTPNGKHGDSFMNVPGTSPAIDTATYYYPMNQSARLLWYHDHAMGITRTNAYSGIASALLLTDAFETWLLGLGLLPDLVGIPLIIQDKSFVPANILTQDPTWQWGDVADLWYPHVYEVNNGPGPRCVARPKGRWDYGGCATPPMTPVAGLPDPSVVAEGFLDTTLVNGAPYPVVNVSDKVFRLRLLNGSQARFWHLNLYQEDASSPGEPDTSKPGPTLYQIGTEGGFLPGIAAHPNGVPIPLVDPADPNTANPDGPFNLLLAPAERADLLVDFSGLAGQSFILYNDAPAPFPGGDPRNDYFTGDDDQRLSGGAPPTAAGFGPNTRTVLKIAVGMGSASLSRPDLGALNRALSRNFDGAAGKNDGIPPQQPRLLAKFDPGSGQYVIPSGVHVFNKTLNEDFDDLGRLLQRGGTDTPFKNNQGLTTFGRDYVSEVTENPSAGEIQVWDVYNNTGDTHPWHFHLVNVQIIGRGIFGVDATTGLPAFGHFTNLSGQSGRLTPPDDNELGWKETVRMNPGEVTRVIMKFDLPKLPAALGDPKSPRTGGHEYVHHCHILEHEEHDMMRPLVVR